MTTPRRRSLPYLASLSLLCLPVSGYAQSILLTAEQFALLGGTAVTVGGAGPTTISNGNVGSAASISGFPPATIVNGTTLLGGAIVEQALTDLITARNGLTALASPAANNLTGQDLSGQTLRPGVYKFDVAAEISLNGTKILTLDAEGQNNVSWVFNIGTSLTTAAGAQIQFVNLGSNGGLDNGLFWNAGTAITFGAGNVVAGNYLAGTNITFGTTLPGAGSGSGRALALAGVSFDGSGTLNALGAPGGGDLTGGLALGGGGTVSVAGYVLLSSSGAYAPGTTPLPPGGTRVVITPGLRYNTTGVTLDGVSADSVGQAPASLTVFSTAATLTRVNTYTGGTTVSNGTLTLVGNGTLGGTSGPLVVDAGLLDLGGSSQTVGAVSLSRGGSITHGTLTGTSYASTGGAISANLTGPGTFTNTHGTTSLSGANTYTGGTAIDSGALVASSQTLPANRPVSTGNGGALIFAQTSDGTFGGLISGTGSVVKQDTGTLTLTQANTYTGGTFVTNGTLIASTGTLPANGSVNLAADSSIVLDQASNGVFAGTVSGLGLVEKRGTGSVTLAQALDLPVTISAGSLVMNGGLGRTLVSSGATLRGVGTITGNLTNQGVIRPGFSPGIITVNGNYTQGPGGRLVIEIASATSFDQVIVAGTASLGGTLQVETLAGFNPVGRSYTVLSALGGVTGTFATFVTVVTTAAVDANLSYTANSATVSFTQIPFVNFALTPNQRAVAAAAQQSPALTVALNAVPLTTSLPAALNALSPQGYQVWSDAAFARGTALADHLSRDQGTLPTRSDFYFDVGQRRGRAQRDLDVGSASFDSDAALVGYNGVTRPGLVLGALFNYEDTDSDLGSAASHSTSKSYLVGVRAAWSRDSWFVHSLVGYGHNDYESTRAIRFPGTTALARSSTEGREWLADISAGRHFMVGVATLSPFVGIHAGGWNAKSFTESGAGVFNQTVGGQSAHSLQSQAGLEAALDLTVGGVGLRPHIRAAWLHEFENRERSIDAQLDSISYAVVTRDSQRDSARLGVGLDATITPSVSLYADYAAQTGDVTRILGEWRAGVSIGF